MYESVQMSLNYEFQVFSFASLTETLIEGWIWNWCRCPVLITTVVIIFRSYLLHEMGEIKWILSFAAAKGQKKTYENMVKKEQRSESDLFFYFKHVKVILTILGRNVLFTRKFINEYAMLLRKENTFLFSFKMKLCDWFGAISYEKLLCIHEVANFINP